MQLYYGFLTEFVCLSLPMLIIQGINNALMEQWKPEAVFSMGVLAANFFIGIKGIMSISDKMTQERND
mgnify:CR=1 FL=1